MNAVGYETCMNTELILIIIRIKRNKIIFCFLVVVLPVGTRLIEPESKIEVRIYILGMKHIKTGFIFTRTMFTLTEIEHCIRSTGIIVLYAFRSQKVIGPGSQEK